jgi:hypothetical protein
MMNGIHSRVICTGYPTPSPARLVSGLQSITLEMASGDSHLSSDAETYPDRWSLVETDGEGGAEGLGQMDGHLARTSGGLCTCLMPGEAGSPELRAHHVADHRLGNSQHHDMSMTMPESNRIVEK